MKKGTLVLTMAAAFLTLGAGEPVYDYLSIAPPADAVVYARKPPSSAPEPELSPPRRLAPERYRAMFAAASARYDVPPGVLESIAYVESGFRAQAQSPERASGRRDLGMFQFNSGYVSWYSERYNGGVIFDPHDPQQAIRIAAAHIRFLYERYGNWPDAFMAYNAGMERIDKGEIPSSAKNYLAKIYSI